MAETVYLLCAVASLGCAALLMRSWSRTRSRLLLWCGLSFCCFAAGNVLLFIDLVLVPNIDLSIIRHSITLAGLGLMLFGLTWETK